MTTTQSRRVLLVEDSRVDQMLTTRVLDVVVAQNGTEAIAAIQSQPFDLVLMDVEMPEMDGLEATRRIRKLEQQTDAHTPIVGLTSIDRQVCLDAGMDEHLHKTTKDHLLGTISRMLPSIPVEVPCSD